MKRELPPNINDKNINGQNANAVGNPFKVVYGNLIQMADEGKFDVIVHGCNCHCTMGAGIAKTIKDKWPEAYAADLRTKKGDRSKLGTFSLAQVGDLTIINLYSQYNFTRDKVDVEYEALEEGFRRIREAYAGKRIGLPLIGVGLAGGNWAIVREIIGDIFKGEDVTVVIFQDGTSKPKVEEHP
jgi:O-acetyl-ADP-ribose deacetylase (regulator of RNase III)